MAQTAEVTSRKHEDIASANDIHDKATRILETYGNKVEKQRDGRTLRLMYLNITPSVSLDYQHPTMIIQLTSVGLVDEFSTRADDVTLGVYELISDIRDASPRKDFLVEFPDGTRITQPYREREHVELREWIGEIRATKAVMGLYENSYRKDVTHQGLRKVGQVLDYVSEFSKQFLEVKKSRETPKP